MVRQLAATLQSKCILVRGIDSRVDLSAARVYLEEAFSSPMGVTSGRSRRVWPPYLMRVF